MTELLTTRFSDGFLDRVTAKLKTQGLNPDSRGETVRLALQQFLTSTGAPVQIGARPEVSLLSPKTCEGSEVSGPNHQIESPAGAPEPANASAYPIHPSRLPFEPSHTGRTDSNNSLATLTQESNNTPTGKTDITLLSQQTKERLILINAKMEAQLTVESARQETKRIYRGVYHPSRIIDVETEPKMPDFNDISHDVPMPKTEAERQRLRKQLEQTDKEKLAEINKKIRQIVS